MLRKRVSLLDVTAQTSTITSESPNICDRRSQRALARLRSNAVVTGTLAIVIQHNDSAAATTGWKTIATFTTQTNETGNSGVQDIALDTISTHLFPHLRAVATIGGGGSYTFTVDLWLD